MKQNVYDDPRFFDAYRKLRDRDSGLNGAVEEPAFLTLLPELQGLSLLDLGSGFGDFCRFARTRGASSVRGVEISRRMIETAKSRTNDPQIEYVNVAIEDFPMQANAYDIVVSRLALHYIRDYEPVIHSIHAGLRDRGVFIFSVEHPICTALCEGWYENDQGEKILWPVDNYSIEGERKRSWFIDDVIKYHRTVETYVNTLLDSGFAITRLLEPHAVTEHLKKRPGLKDTLRRPSFLIVAAVKAPNLMPSPAV
jgi:SAM-dependent methyltransferase